MSDDRVPGFATLSVHAGAKPDPAKAPVDPNLPHDVVVFDDVDHAAALFGLRPSATSTPAS